MRIPPRTLVEALSALPRGEARGFRFIGSDGQERYFPYQALEAEALRRASMLHVRGIEKGDRVALVVPEGHEFVLTFLGVVLAGAVPVPIFPRATFKATSDYSDTVGHIVDASRSKLLLAMEQNLTLVEPVRSKLPLGIVTTEQAFVGDAPPFTPPALTPDDLCFLQFTSGSTSRPKGVMVSHGNLIANATAFLGPHGLRRNDRDVGVSWLPLFHDMGLIGFILGPLVMDIPVVILPTASFARGPKIWLETITKYRGTITYAPNFAYALASKRIKERDLGTLDLSCLRVAGCGAEPIQAATLKEFARVLAPVGMKETSFLPSYGMAEATLAITFHDLGTPLRIDHVDAVALRQGRAEPSTSMEEHATLELVGCGVPFPEHALRIADAEGNALPERRVGEVWARGPSVSAGYYENAEANAEGFPGDGWLHTGDLGYLADGELFICGRSKDLIIVRGANYHPQDLEWAVSELEGVRRGNVVAFSTQLAGDEKLVLTVECGSADAEAVRTRVASRINEAFGLAPHEVVCVTLGSLPKTSSGKVQRRKTRDLYLDGGLERHPSLAHKGPVGS